MRHPQSRLFTSNKTSNSKSARASDYCHGKTCHPDHCHDRAQFSSSRKTGQVFIVGSCNDDNLHQESPAIAEDPSQDSVRDHVQVRAKRQVNASVRMSSLCSHAKEKRLKWDPKTHEGLFKDTYKCQGCNDFSTSR